MNEIGIMVYGYDEVTARSISSHLEGVLGKEVLLISGCGREGDLVGDIIEDEVYAHWEAKEDPRLVMFLGFDGPSVHSSMDNFPSFKGQNRPIFCTPTEKNIEWSLKALLEDLMEEREYFRKRDEKLRSPLSNEKAL
ncbi:MAG: DUF3783 domain-containing protein [Candidatus Thermoplasmatota archaeon]|nr:DUF3783 domain-containing protein [Candidatus Thermoplasmatota archaeon]